MHAIRIVNTPPGFADEEIRKQWVGLRIPLVPEGERELAKMKFKDPEKDGHIVYGVDAVQALLDERRVDAARFWSTPAHSPYLRFDPSCCELVD